MYIPEGFGTLFPYMVIENAGAFADFLKDTFNAQEMGRSIRKGRIANIRMKIGTSAFMVSEASADNMKAMPASYYVYVEDVDATFAKALANGANRWFDPQDMPYQDRQAGIIDPFGNMWAISHRLVQEGYD